jgi:hypothetical protein
MGLPKRLTEMQMRFAEYYVYGDENGPVTKTEAALKAGYSPKRARQEGSELTNPKLSPLVVKYMGELREERIKKHEVTYEGHIAELARLREAALKKGSFSSAVNAEANRGKAAGLYIDRKILYPSPRNHRPIPKSKSIFILIVRRKQLNRFFIFRI